MDCGLWEDAQHVTNCGPVVGATIHHGPDWGPSEEACGIDVGVPVPGDLEADAPQQPICQFADGRGIVVVNSSRCRRGSRLRRIDDRKVSTIDSLVRARRPSHGDLEPGRDAGAEGRTSRVVLPHGARLSRGRGSRRFRSWHVLGRRGTFDRRAQRHLSSLCRERGIDLIHAHDAASLMAGAVARVANPRAAPRLHLPPHSPRRHAWFRAARQELRRAACRPRGGGRVEGAPAILQGVALGCRPQAGTHPLRRGHRPIPSRPGFAAEGPRRMGRRGRRDRPRVRRALWSREGCRRRARSLSGVG